MSAQPLLCRTLLASALALAAASAVAAPPPIDAVVDFDNVASGAAANDALGSLVSAMHFANPDREDDVDADGSLTGGFHWIDATALYGDVLVSASAAAVSGPNVLSNFRQPILLSFAAPVRLTSFSIQQDLSGYGNLQAQGSYLAFLDATGHEMAAASVHYTQGAQPGLTIQSLGPVANVSAILLAGGSDYDNLRLTAVSAVPEPGPAALWLAGAGVCVLAGRRRRL